MKVTITNHPTNAVYIYSVSWGRRVVNFADLDRARKFAARKAGKDGNVEERLEHWAYA